MFTLTRSEFRLTLVFAAILWFMTIFDGDFYLTVILTWAVALYWRRWHIAHPGEKVFEEPESKKKEEKPADHAPEHHHNHSA